MTVTTHWRQTGDSLTMLAENHLFPQREMGRLSYCLLYINPLIFHRSKAILQSVATTLVTVVTVVTVGLESVHDV